MKIIIIYNQVTSLSKGLPEDILADEDTVKTVGEIKNALESLGHDVEKFDVNEDSVNEIENLKADLIFNQAYGVGNTPNSESIVAALLEKHHLSFTGSSEKAMVLSNNKLATKQLLQKHHIPTPKQYTQVEKTNFPAIVKLNETHCSIGLNQKSVVEDFRELQMQITSLSQKYADQIFVEEFIPGRELNVCVIGNGEDIKVLPVSEIIFSKKYKNKFKIIDFAAKWVENSEEYQSTLEAVCPAILEPNGLSLIEEYAIASYKLIGCRDYARVDMRLNQDGKPFVLEVNTNPGIGPDDGAIRSAKAAGITYSGFLAKIIEFAASR